MTTPDTHTLNACLARVIGKEVFETGYPALFVYRGPNYLPEQWNPLHDANQIEEVEAWLHRSLLGWSIETYGSQYLARVWNQHPQIGSSNAWEGVNPDKKRAFALAVREMEKGKQ